MGDKMEIFIDDSRYGLFKKIQKFLENNEVTIVSVKQIDHDSTALLYRTL